MAITRFGDVSAGFLAKWLLSVAGESDRYDVNSFSLQLGAHLERRVQIGSLPVRMEVEYDHGLQVPQM
jgi:hypothetical protein